VSNTRLDHTEARAQMPAGHRDGIDRLLPQLGRELGQITIGQFAQVGGCLHPIEQRRLAGGRHVSAPD
jgi:hypothetical protein